MANAYCVVSLILSLALYGVVAVSGQAFEQCIEFGQIENYTITKLSESKISTFQMLNESGEIDCYSYCLLKDACTGYSVDYNMKTCSLNYYGRVILSQSRNSTAWIRSMTITQSLNIRKHSQGFIQPPPPRPPIRETTQQAWLTYPQTYPKNFVIFRRCIK